MRRADAMRLAWARGDGAGIFAVFTYTRFMVSRGRVRLTNVRVIISASQGGCLSTGDRPAPTALGIPLETLRTTIHRYFAPHRHSALLAAIIATFAVRPIVGETAPGFAIFGIAAVILLIVALYNINVDELVGERGHLLAQARRRRILGWTLATAAGAERIAVIFVRSQMLNLAGSICWLLFVVFVTLSQLRSLLKQRTVTGETICMAVSVYLLIGFAWAFLYALIFQLHPESFAGIAAEVPGHPTEVQHSFPLIGYFSLTTLSTIGFGDITPLTLQARYAAVAEGITGQFYMAILVARLVGLQMNPSAAQDSDNR
jgi:voltage-gated potassium channel